MKRLFTTIAAALLVGCEKESNLKVDYRLFNAVIAGNIEAVKQHLSDGADANTTSILGEEDAGWTPLHKAAAAWEVHKEIVVLLIDNDANVNAKNGWGSTPLHYAAYNGDHLEIAELLIDNGADVNAKNDWGSTTLHYAAHNGDHWEISKLLIDNGADVNAKDEDANTPLDIAIDFEHTEIVNLLRKHGVKMH